jgi:hypothetical protein
MMEILRCAWLIWRKESHDIISENIYAVWGISQGLKCAKNKILEMLDVATLGDIDWEDIKKAPMRI